MFCFLQQSGDISGISDEVGAPFLLKKTLKMATCITSTGRAVQGDWNFARPQSFFHLFVKSIEVNRLHTLWPIFWPHPICTNQGTWKFFTFKRPNANTRHRRTSHLNTNTELHFPTSIFRFWPSCHSDLVGSRHGWGLFVKRTDGLTLFVAVEYNQYFLR